MWRLTVASPARTPTYRVNPDDSCGDEPDSATISWHNCPPLAPLPKTPAKVSLMTRWFLMVVVTAGLLLLSKSLMSSGGVAQFRGSLSLLLNG